MSARDRTRLYGAVTAIVVAIAVIGVWVTSSGRSPITPTTTGPAPSSTITTNTTVPPTSLTTTSTQPITATSLVAPSQTSYDVIVVGDSMGGATAATVAARLGADTLLLSPTSYFGGQAGGAGVATMDEGGNRYVLRRSGIYQELVRYIEFSYPQGERGACYFFPDSLCPEPSVVDQFYRNVLGEAGVDVAPVIAVTDVVQNGNTVTGLIADGHEYQAKVVIDATEFSDLYPMIEGLGYEVGDGGGCVQDTTWLAIRNWYQGGAPAQLVPPETAMSQLYDIYGTGSDRWLDEFRGTVVADSNRPEGTGPMAFPWDFSTETAYRALADGREGLNLILDKPTVTRSGVNHANDYPVTIAAIEDPAARQAEFRRALHKTYAFLWYLRWELGATDWGVANDLGYSQANRLLWDDLIPDEIEANLPPIPYLREGRRMLASYNLGAADLADDVREKHRFDDAVMLGGYFTDFHGCPAEDQVSGYGLFEVPLGTFIPEQIDGFLPGLARAAGVSRTASAAVRTQPEEMWGGQVAGIIAGLAVRNGVAPRAVSVDQVQSQLRDSGLVFFLPG